MKIGKNILGCILFSLMFFSVCNATEQFIEIVQSSYIFKNPPFKECHASTIIELDNQKLMAAWFAGSYEGNPDVCIWISTYENKTWGTPVKVAAGITDSTDQKPCWNPVLFKAKNKRIYLFYKVGDNPREWWGMVKTSNDDGATWSKGYRLPHGFLGPVKNKPIQLMSGKILCPSSTESPDFKYWNIHLEITNEELNTWEKVFIDTNSQFGVIQPAILQCKEDKLMILCRSRENCIIQTWSDENEYHWSKLKKTDLPNPNSGIDAVTLSNGLQLLVYNPLLKGTDWYNGRNKLNIALSKNEEDWEDIIILEDEKTGEFSYPAVIQSENGLIHITYTVNRTDIKHIILKITL